MAASGADPWGTLSADPAVASAEVTQRVLPALKARQETASLKAAARREWFAGKGTLEAAFPELAPARLGSASVVAGRLVALDEAATARASERVAPLPPLSATQTRLLRDAVQKALDAEDAADDLERRFLLGIKAFHAAHPELTDDALQPLRSRLEAAWTTADEAARSGPEEGRIEAARRAAVLDEERLALDRLLRDLRRAGTVPGAALPSPAADLAAASDPVRGQWARERLALVRPFVGPDDAGRIDALAPIPEPAPVPAEPVVDATAVAREEAAEAVAAAEEARRAAIDERDVRLAEVREASATAHARRLAAWESVDALIARDEAKRTELAQALAAGTTKAGSVKARLGFGQTEVDLAYADLRRLVETLRAETRLAEAEFDTRWRAREEGLRRAVSEEAEVRAARWDIRSGGDAVVRASRDEALSHWEAAIDDEVRALLRGATVARKHRDAVATMLLDARAARRTLRPQISTAEWDRDRALMGIEVAAEVELLGPSTAASARERVRALRGAPRALLDVNVIVGFVRGSLLTIIVALVWWLMRGRTDRMAREFLDRLRKASPTMRPADVNPVAPPLERLLRAVIDWLLGSLLVTPVGALVPELGFLLRTWMFVAGWRFFVSLYDVLFVRHPDTRVGLIALPAETWDLARRTVRILATWAAVRIFSRYVLFRILGADVLDVMVRFALDLVGVIVVVSLLHSWEPTLRRRMEHLDRRSRVVRVLAAGPPSPVLRAAWAAADAAWLLAASIWAVINQLATQRESLGHLVNVVTRYRLKGESQAVLPREPIGDEVRAIIQAENPPAGTRVERPDVDGALWDAWTTWDRTRRQGLVALVGDRGAGKRTTLDHFQARLKDSGMRLERHKMRRRLTTEADVMAWAQEAMKLPRKPENAEAFVRMLLEMEPRIIVIESVQAAFLRTVNGFGALRVILYAASACAHRHFFVFGIHKPAWRYLSQLGILVNTSVFGTIVMIPRMNEDDLRRIALARLDSSGWKVDFHGLVRSSPFGGDPDVELERTTGAFFRLIAEASAGNPGIALDMFADSLTPSGRPKVADAFMARSLELGIVEGLTTGDLFTLVALRTQDLLHLDEIVAVTNMLPGEIKATVKHLEQRGLVAVAEGWVRVHETEMASVTRTLRRRQFLPG